MELKFKQSEVKSGQEMKTLETKFNLKWEILQQNSEAKFNKKWKKLQQIVLAIESNEKIQEVNEKIDNAKSELEKKTGSDRAKLPKL